MERAVQRKIVRRAVDGVLLLDKPKGLTSNAALQTARRLLNAAKAGHTGTLDPMASGLLPLTFGEATKFSQMLLDADKTYLATVVLGAETDTGDADGEVVRTHPVDVSETRLQEVLADFRGEIRQVPPMYSALKRDGKPLYEYARAGIELEREARVVHIHRLELKAFSDSGFTIEVDCSKGTYIRSLATDIGAALGCGGHLSALRRTRIGAFTVEEAVTLRNLEECDTPETRDAHLEAADKLVQHLPAVILTQEQAGAVLQGRPLALRGEAGGCCRLYGPSDFLGLAEWKVDGKLWPKRLIATATSTQST
ncbi:tRNA pseudouridine(55) synthase TruB [Azoarcus indigens]|uniref:tRNA pseudouridine synthase B n=1 Tax=Azoarcus indigens TaxID=29545 RepID=A0A4R6EEF5_9RHOO|nr:tRNA pseudouridine(55) synthase TruB [Azoarcus indigens]NMG66223.1 tRNA pseudouridine(55) synthase TruB [Azoarcus indigens]TDN56632.1 tRNA pseudouridine synthase B [Azoarcus indigens]